MPARRKHTRAAHGASFQHPDLRLPETAAFRLSRFLYAPDWKKRFCGQGDGYAWLWFDRVQRDLPEPQPVCNVCRATRANPQQHCQCPWRGEKVRARRKLRATRRPSKHHTRCAAADHWLKAPLKLKHSLALRLIAWMRLTLLLHVTLFHASAPAVTAHTSKSTSTRQVMR